MEDKFTLFMSNIYFKKRREYFSFLRIRESVVLRQKRNLKMQFLKRLLVLCLVPFISNGSLPYLD
jgi:hypothetical protein